MSPTIFREDGYQFFFFSREEPRMHVHVYCGLNRKELSDIERILGERKDEIIERWKQHHSDKR